MRDRGCNWLPCAFLVEGEGWRGVRLEAVPLVIFGASKINSRQGQFQRTSQQYTAPFYFRWQVCPFYLQRVIAGLAIFLSVGDQLAGTHVVPDLVDAIGRTIRHLV